MIDVDDFKEINDHLGHVYGDAVLCELGEKLVRIFRGNDIVGRIGGDEFIVFLKDGAVDQKAEEKAKAICKAFQITYKGLNGEGYTISSSIGISFSPRDGSSFKDLYNHADIALYAAKNGGKNTYNIYDGSKFTGYTSQRTKIQTIGNISQKDFRTNRIEFVFKMLYHSESPVAAIHSALELVARQEVMNHLDNYIYVIRPDTFEVLFMNDKIQKLIKESPSNAFCYSFFRGNAGQCEDCPIRRLGDNETERVICEVYNAYWNSSKPIQN